jgi:hypothetical protein
MARLWNSHLIVLRGGLVMQPASFHSPALVNRIGYHEHHKYPRVLEVQTRP